MGANSRRKSEKALKIKFCGFKFRDSNQSSGVALLATQTMKALILVGGKIS